MKKWILIIIGLLGVDQLAKYLVNAHFTYEGETVPVIQNFFHITYVRNPGVVFGLGGDTGIPYFFLIGVAILAGLAFGYMLYKNDFTDKRTIWYVLALSLLIAGSFGNAIDRVAQFDHKVVDFIDFRGIWNYVFNIADMCLTVGIGVFIVDQLFLEPKRTKSK
ncbi:MAG: signal peptidase II [Candidatus Izemoplasmatales bacterium]|nr:signal peptidase II [Candidatus Izemoplasmatales bacterium]